MLISKLISNINLYFYRTKKIYFDNNIISYDKFYELFNISISKKGKEFNDNCQYRLTQCFDKENNPTEHFYMSNYSLGKNTTYKSVKAIEFTRFGLVFQKRQDNHGIFTNINKTKLLRYLGRTRQIVNGPYILKINFGDYLALSNDLLMLVPKNKKKDLFS